MKPTTYGSVNMTLPNGIWFDSGDVSLDIQTQTTVQYFEGDYAPVPNPINSTSLSFANFSGNQASVILDFFVLYVKIANPNSTENAYRALEVLFYWCVNSYSTNVTAGNVTTEIVASSSNVVSPGDGDSQSPMVLKSGTDTTEYTVDVYAADVLTYYLLPNLGTGNFSQSPLDASSRGGTQVSRGFTSQGAEVVSYALLPAGMGSTFNKNAELADEDATNFKAVQNLTNNLATSLTNT